MGRYSRGNGIGGMLAVSILTFGLIHLFKSNNTPSEIRITGVNKALKDVISREKIGFKKFMGQYKRPNSAEVNDAKTWFTEENEELRNRKRDTYLLHLNFKSLDKGNGFVKLGKNTIRPDKWQIMIRAENLHDLGLRI